MIAAGTRIEITAPRMGGMAHPEARHFERTVADVGDRGRYLHEQAGVGMDGWHILAVAVGEDVLFVPAHSSHFKTIEDSS